MEKIVVWDLFGGGNKSVYKSLDKNKYEIYTFDILQDQDLSKNFNQLKKDYFNKIPKPDIIVASPPCESWSLADCGGRIWNSDLSFKNESYYEKYNIKASPNKRRNFYKKSYSRSLSELLILNTIEIIKKYKPTYWYIENPQTSMIWKYIKSNFNINGFFNVAWYGSYDNNFSKKPTTFFSNIKLELKKEKTTFNKRYMLDNSYNQRSAIPTKLIQDIFNVFGGNNE